MANVFHPNVFSGSVFAVDTPNAFEIAADGGTYVITGAAVGLLGGFAILAESGSYLITGNPATTLTWSGEGDDAVAICVYIPTFRTRRGR